MQNVITNETEDPNFRVIPDYSRYGIYSDGTVVYLPENRPLKGSVNPAGYVNYRITADSGVTKTWGRHRLLAATFKDPGIPIDNLTVNHVNGIKGDDRLENLEWVTYQGNQEHAGAMRLTEKCIPVSVRDIDTGQVVKYPSIIKCAQDLCLSKDAVNYRVKIGEQRIFPERKQYRAFHEDLPWYVPSDVDSDLLSNGVSKSVQARLVLTGEVYTFPRLTDLAERLNVSASTVSHWLTNPHQPVLPGMIQIKWTQDSTPWRIPKDPYLELDQNSNYTPVVVINPDTGNYWIFESAVECAHEAGLKTTALDYRLKSKGTKTFSDGYAYCYYKDFVQFNS